jgi:hypothetical protein
MKRGPAWEAMWTAFHTYVFSGDTFRTEKAPKPERPPEG